MDLGLIFSGFLVGATIGLTGVGGGSLMTPLLVFVFGVAPAVAVGTDLLYAAVTKGGGIGVHYLRKTIEWHIVGLLALGSIPSSLMTVFVLKEFHASGIVYESLITSTLGVALILTSIVLLFRTQILEFSQHDEIAAVCKAHSRYRAPITVCAGVVLGVLVTLSSVGAGALGTALLYFLYPRLKVVNIVGTDLAHAVPLTAIAGLGHAHLGTVDYALLGYLLLGSLPGIYLGSHLGTRLPDRLVRGLLASMLFMIGLRFALSS